ncbi:concanavalin A-like lectin/glucanase domain-containing protein [Podospora australis]|uniref:chitinase n=1 Tax=Podospora australis TaxID=1536484 RepID=A0AAN6WJC5_9PEZI|nr:concanavalin A-like lectin/glucanase domain-containing protein [Podospora australis]
MSIMTSLSWNSVRFILGLVGWLVSLVTAQTWTSCNPTVQSCPPDVGLAAKTYAVDFRNGPDHSHWAPVAGAVTYTPLGAAFTVAKKGDSPTLQTSWYFFFGRAEVRVRAAPGTGIVSCVVLESDDLDEIDWEWIGGEPYEVQTNYFGKGNTTTYDRGGKTYVHDAQGATHNYTIDWTPDVITWYVDGTAVRALAYRDAVGGKNFPQTPVRLRLGIWAGGDSGNPNGTIDWAGGVTNYTNGPFTMYVESVSVTNLHPATSYAYSDLSGSWASITVNSTAPSLTSRIAPLGSKVGASGHGPAGARGGELESGGMLEDDNSYPSSVYKDVTVSSDIAGGSTGVASPMGRTKINNGSSTIGSISRGTAPPNLISGESSALDVTKNVRVAIGAMALLLATSTGII